MNTMTFYLLALLGYIFANFIFKKIFYNGKLNEDNWLVFNLSPFAETMLTTLYLSVGVYEIVILSTTLPKWYEWIFTIFWILFFLMKGLFVLVTSKNYIKIKNNTVEYYKTITIKEFEKGTFDFDSYRFIIKKTEAPFSEKGLFLELNSIEDEKKQIEFDLKEMDLEGFKDSMEKYLEKLEIKKHYI